MSRASSRAPDDQTKLKKQLTELCKLEANKFCADCGCRGPRWASINLGVFICIACSGIHRSLGVHLTFVRSVNLDSWTVEQVKQMQRWGNARAKEYYEANVPRDYRIPTEHSSVREKEMWIREKYERKRFIAQDVPKESRRKQESSDEEEEEEETTKRRSRRKEGSSSRHGSRTASREATPTVTPSQPKVTNDILSFDVFSAPVPKQEPLVPVVTAQPATQDEWASFGGSTNAQGGFKDAFAPAPVDQHKNQMANIMASFGSSSTPQQNAFPPQQGMPPAPMGMNVSAGMNNMGMMQPRPMGMNMGMAPQQQNFMNPMMQQNMMQQPNMMQQNMMGQQPNMMGQQNMMMNPFGQQQGMMNGNGFQGAPMGMNPMGMNPMGMNPMGMQMNQGGFQQQQQQQRPPQQQQQPQAGGLNQPFVSFG